MDRHISSYARNLIQQIKKKHHVDYLLIIRPSYAYGVGGDDLSLLLNGFGVYSCGVWKWKQVSITGGSRIHLFNTHDVSQYWHIGAEFHVKVPIEFWKNSFSGYSKTEVEKIINTTKTEYPRAINMRIRKMMRL